MEQRRGMGFFTSPRYLFTSESVTEGHPDKICDQVSDAVLDAYLAQDRYARVACETVTTRGLVMVMGEVCSPAQVEVPELVRQVVREIGYTRPEYGLDCDTCAVLVALQPQSPEIAQAVQRGDPDDPGEVGAGDQGMMVGFACREEVDGETLDTQLMPLPIYLAHRLCRRLAQVRREGLLPYLRPDGKSQVTVEYSYGKPRRVHTVLVSAQHDPGAEGRIYEDIIQEVVRAVVPPDLLDSNTCFLVNPSDRFILGGPAADTGLTGRKILVDTYGGVARHGGGCFSGKDPTKVDRSGAYAARYVAKNLVAAGLAERVEVQVSYAIGRAEPIAVSVETFGTGALPDERLVELVLRHFDLRPGAIIRDMDLRRPIYRPVAVYGHFGREDLDLPWERTDKADLLRREVGLPSGAG